MRGLFPDGEDQPPRLKTEDAQSWTLNDLANSYARSGQSGRAAPLFRIKIVIDEKAGDKKNLAVGLANVALDQINLGHFRGADQGLRRSIELNREGEDEFGEATGHGELARSPGGISSPLRRRPRRTRHRVFQMAEAERQTG